jgi:hypothetical protein
MIVPPAENLYSGILRHSASKDVHVVEFHGPSPEVDKGQKMSPDNGRTNYGKVLVDLGNNMANFAFSRDGLAIVSLRNVPFTISYAIVSQKS